MRVAEYYIEKLLSHYNVYTISELSDLISIGQPSISKWKTNNSINLIKKKCRELDIYDIIFKDESSDSKTTIDMIETKSTTSIPTDINSDLETLFKLATSKDSLELLINNIDDFIYQQKKILREK
ncbi:MAG: hypothetical protein U9N59_07100 [Campylobacterota bacterium]|nr:hypothetical protein [Campylobacterota bacterium]